MVFEATVAHPVKVKSEPLEDDDVLTGLVDCDNDKGGDDNDENEDDEEFPRRIEMPDSDYSDFGAEGDQDSDQLEMQVIYDQQQRNRNTGQVSEIKLMQVKAEIEDTEDTGDKETQQMSLETEDSFIPLSTGDTEGQSTLPSSEDVEVTTQDQEETLDRELINLAVMKPVQEYKQKFLQNVQEDSEKVMHPTEGCELLEYEKKIAEGWRQTIEDDRVVREQMEREETEQATRQIEEELEKQAKGSEAQPQSPATVKEEVIARRKEKGLLPLLPRNPGDQ